VHQFVELTAVDVRQQHAPVVRGDRDTPPVRRRRELEHPT